MSVISHKYIFIAICAILASCSTNTVYHRYYPIEGNGWKRTDTISFTLNDSLDTGIYSTKIGVRHTVSYPYRDLWLSVSLPDKEKSDTVHLYLANERGNWNGNGTASGYYQYESDGPIFNYRESSDSVIKICHIMKGFILPSISDIGISISRSINPEEDKK